MSWRARLGWRAVAIAASLALIVSLMSMCLGAMSLDPWQLLSLSALERQVLWSIRAPRVLMGLFVGGGLAMSGAALQGLFRNPLADPGLIGVSGGAALGAVLWIVFGVALGGSLGFLEVWAMPAAAFLGGLGATLLVWRLSMVDGQIDVATMLLAGIAVGVLVGAVIGLATYLSSEQQLRTLTLWTMGSLASSSWEQVLIVALCLAPGVIGLWRVRGPLDVIAIGQREAMHLGIPVSKIQRQVVVCVALIVGASVGFTGMIGFVGLVVPHLWRLIAGPSHKTLLPGAMCLGAALLTGADLMARTLIAPSELPIGVLMSFIGGPFFLFLLVQRTQRHRTGAYDA